MGTLLPGEKAVADTMMKPDWDSIEKNVLGKLKPFQRRTAEWAFSRLYPDGGDSGSRSPSENTNLERASYRLLEKF
jgi:hypothetical protein